MSQVQEIKDKLDIVEIVGERVKLSRSGKNFRGVCPFHSEKTPSFFVSPDLQSFMCFGCHKQGDAFTFLQEIDRLTFPEALEALAHKAGVTLEKKWNDPQETKRQRLFEALTWAQKYYSYLLLEHARGEAARAYLKDRGISASMAKGFGLGFATDSWDALGAYLIEKKKFTEEELLESGLAVRGQRGQAYDRFRGRLMFPLHDHRGRVVGFSGRLMDANAKEAKYINTSETELYHKRYLLYGYWQNLEAIREKESVIIVEGEFDVLSSVKAHVKNVVAVKGSALTEDQVRMLARTVQTIYLALDADNAGIDATKRAIALVQNFPVALRVIPITGGKDPDDLAQSDPKRWREITETEHTPAFEYLLDHAFTANDPTTAQGQKVITNEMLAVLATIEHSVERTFYLRQLAERLRVSESVMEEQWQQFQQGQMRARLAPHREARADSTAQKPAEPPDTLGAYFFEIVLQHPAKAQAQLHTLAAKNQPTADWFHELALKRLFESLQKHLAHTNFSVRALSQQLPAELQPRLAELFVPAISIEEKQFDHELTVTLAQLEQRHRKQQIQEIGKKMQELEAKEDPTQEEQETITKLQQKLRELTQ